MPPDDSVSASSSASGSDAEITFPIEYDEFAGQSFEADARGRGRLVIEGAGAFTTFTFIGPAQPSLSLGRELEFVFAVQKIRNVSVQANRITFDGTFRNGTAPEQTFAFHCLTPADTATVTRLLPAARDPAFDQDQELLAQLDRLPEARTPWTSVTGLIVAANVLVFVLMGLAGAGWLTAATDLTPYLRYGANHGLLTVDGQWWRLITSTFLHYGILHLALNMWALFQAGQLLEKLLGRALFTLVYFASGLCGGLVTILWNGSGGGLSAGASGAVFGVCGALLGYMLREKHALPRSLWEPCIKGTISFAGYNLVIGMMLPNIGNAAHLGGLAGGFAFGWLLAVPLDLEIRRHLIPPRLRLGAAVLVAVFAAGVISTRARLSDELAWSATFDATNQRDNALLAVLTPALNTYRPDQPNTELIRLLAQDIIPFNETWLTSLDPLSLAPPRKTTQRRDLAVTGLRLRLDAYRHLLTAIQKSDPRALSAYNSEMLVADEALRRFMAFR